jgi:cytochrome P450
MTAPGEQPPETPAALRRLLPADMVERVGYPFAPPPGLLRGRRGGGAVQPLELANGAPGWLVTGMAEARTVLGDARFRSDRVRHPAATQPADAPRVESRTDGMFVFMDPPEHTRLRRLLTGQFTVRRMRALETHVREIAVAFVDAMRAAGTEADLVPAYALPTPS